ncbi:MAG: hypothetical protein KatS3mg076_0035 [Candidatus Binatia bacterium]|nr:MAG: hypothetical protein KatS3mg076_0035 [Candidatus Binatia bacterium]
MKSVSVSELKAHLSRYIRRVQRGGEVEIVHRGVPVARLVGIEARGPAPDRRRRQRLIALGILRPGRGGASAVLEQEPIELKGAGISEALEEEREDRL